MRDLVLIAGVMGASFVGLFSPVFGILTFVFLGIFNPHSLTWGFARTFPLSQVAAIATLVGTLSSPERKRFRVQRETLLLLLLWLMFGVSTYFAISPEAAFQKFVNVSKILLMVVLTTIIINTQYRLQLLLRVIALSLGFYAVKGAVFAIMTGGQHIVYGPDRSFLSANNSIGLALAMNVPVLIRLIKVEKNQLLIWIMKAMVLGSYPAVVCTFSRGAWLGLAMVTAFLFLKAKHKIITLPAVAILAVLLLPSSPSILPDRVVNRYDTLVNYEQDASAQSRLWNWEFCKRVGMANPLTGAGFDFYSLQAYAAYYPEFQERFPGKVWSCHSIWLTVLSEHGFSGTIILMALLVSIFSSFKKIRTYAQLQVDNTWAGHYANMVQEALVAFMVVGTFLDALYFDLFYYLVGVVVILKGIMQDALVPVSVESSLEGSVGSRPWAWTHIQRFTRPRLSAKPGIQEN